MGRYITLTEWAVRNDISSACARKKASDGVIYSAKKVGSQWFVIETERLIDLRANGFRRTWREDLMNHHYQCGRMSALLFYFSLCPELQGVETFKVAEHDIAELIHRAYISVVYENGCIGTNEDYMAGYSIQSNLVRQMIFDYEKQTGSSIHIDASL